MNEFYGVDWGTKKDSVAVVREVDGMLEVFWAAPPVSPAQRRLIQAAEQAIARSIL